MGKATVGCMLGILLVIGLPDYGTAERYAIQPGDVLEISVWKDEALSRELVVPPDGVISFPLVGDMNTDQMTVTTLRETVKERLSVYVPDPTVSVMLIQINSLSAYVIGKVNKPGEFPITLETTVMQLLAKAGGLNPFASKGSIRILRRQGDKTLQLPFDYDDVEDGDDLSTNIRILRGDVIVVP